MLINETKIRVRYAETDQMGVVHHATYLLYFEIGRTELLRQFGTTYRKMEEEGLMLPVIDIHCKYIGPALYDDELIIKTIMQKKPGVKVHFIYEVYKANNKICEGFSTLAFTNALTRRPAKPPEWFIQLTDHYF